MSYEQTVCWVWVIISVYELLRCLDNCDVFKSLSSLPTFLHLNIKFAKLKLFKVHLLHQDGPAVNTCVTLKAFI